MQIQKEDIRKVILKVAREEFADKGYKDTSMRTIAQRAEVGLSNIYNYFKNKNEIFREVLSSVLKAFEDSMIEHNNEDYISLDIFSSDEYLRRQTDLFFSLVAKYKEDLRILFFNASGSSLENFRDEIIEIHTQTGREYLRLMKEKYPDVNTDISPFFTHTMCAWFMSSIEELVMHDLSDSEMEQFIREYMEYGTAGWKKILKVK